MRVQAVVTAGSAAVRDRQKKATHDRVVAGGYARAAVHGCHTLAPVMSCSHPAEAAVSVWWSWVISLGTPRVSPVYLCARAVPGVNRAGLKILARTPGAGRARRC
jgi:hypothetical protein